MSGDIISGKHREVAYWSWEVSTGKIKLGKAFSDFFGCKPGDFPKTYKESAPFFSKEDIGQLKETFQAHAGSHGETDFHCVTSHHSVDGEQTFNLQWRGEVIQWDENGEPLLMIGETTKTAQPEPGKVTWRQKAVLFQQMMEYIPDSIYFKDRQSRFLAINKACAEKFGLNSPEEAIGKTDFDFFDDSHAKQARQDEKQVMQTENPIVHKVEKEVTSDNASKERWASTTKLPLYDNEGQVIGTFGITSDITKQKNTEEELQRNDAMISKLSEQVPGFFYLYHYVSKSKSYCPFASHGIRDVCELHPEDVSESIDPIIDRIHKDDVERVKESIFESIKTLKNWKIDFRVNLPNKGLRWLRGKAKPEKQPDGSVMGYGYITDITEEKEIYRINVRLKRQFQAIFDSVPNLIFVKDLQGKYLMANNAFAEFFGYEPENMIGKKDTDFGISEEKAQRFLEADKKVIKNNEPFFIPEDKTKHPDGTDVWHQTIKVPFQHTESNNPAVLSIVTDITQRKKKEAQLSNSLDIIGEQNKRLMNFAHIVSHNLRNHAGSISMVLELFAMEESEEEKKTLLEQLQKAAKRLNETITDLNEIIDEQYKNIHDEKKVSLGEFIDRTKQILTSDIDAHKVTFEENIPETLTFKYNPAYLESILLNLLSNAIKYRHPDRNPVIKIHAYTKGDKVHLDITDNGLGIDLEKHGDKLFGMYKTFHQNENSKGIGLFITKNQIESMGGSIEAESEPGKGTTFKLVLN
ncbi:MAG: PAS domain S-box protein [Gracilimonas sp.]|uniref:PAS domain S-box protein n=1 Tax=Gracilimonas sp. TaxID=1974203 RepID=UPI0019B3E33B|nr:PAS domain S-box protein [Gracilimonas sp.]MBD3617323.1 PAS domain S-box protein [Gracilimonas sp.]